MILRHCVTCNHESPHCSETWNKDQSVFGWHCPDCARRPLGLPRNDAELIAALNVEALCVDYPVAQQLMNAAADRLLELIYGVRSETPSRKVGAVKHPETVGPPISALQDRPNVVSAEPDDATNPQAWRAWHLEHGCETRAHRAEATLQSIGDARSLDAALMLARGYFVGRNAAMAAEGAAVVALPDFRDAYRSEVERALAKGLTQEAAHELGLFAAYLVGKAARRMTPTPRA